MDRSTTDEGVPACREFVEKVVAFVRETNPKRTERRTACAGGVAGPSGCRAAEDPDERQTVFWNTGTALGGGRRELEVLVRLA